jgi:predicted Fe-S protein YdhL (DUF1289 family)
MSRKKVKNPCVDICKLDKTRGFCVGCLRTRAEIKAWKTLSKSERRAVLGEIAGRQVARA